MDLAAIDFYSVAHLVLNSAPEEDSDILMMWDLILKQVPNGGLPILLIDRKPYWRLTALPSYKGNRVPQTDELYHRVINLGMTLPYPQLVETGLEADDWAGVLAEAIASLPPCDRPASTVMVTVDTDWLQLVDDSLGLSWFNVNTVQPSYRTEAETLAWALRRHQVWLPNCASIARLKNLQGDPVDNVPASFETDLTSLQGDSWKASLLAHGFDLSELVNRVLGVLNLVPNPAPVYETA